MAVTIEPTMEMLKACVKACAEAHNLKFFDWSDEAQVAVQGDGVAVVADMGTICESFFGNKWPLNVDWGFSNIFMDEVPLERNLDLESLKFALPNGKLEEILAGFNINVSLGGEEAAKGMETKEDHMSSRHQKSREMYEKFCEAGNESHEKGVKR